MELGNQQDEFEEPLWSPENQELVLEALKKSVEPRRTQEKTWRGVSGNQEQCRKTARGKETTERL